MKVWLLNVSFIAFVLFFPRLLLAQDGGPGIISPSPEKVPAPLHETAGRPDPEPAPATGEAVDEGIVENREAPAVTGTAPSVVTDQEVPPETTGNPDPETAPTVVEVVEEGREENREERVEIRDVPAAIEQEPSAVPDPDPGAGLEMAQEALDAEVKPCEIRMHLPADVSFDLNQFTLRPEAGEALGKVAAIIRAHPRRTVWVEGYTDFTGSQDYNKALSVKRAESVRGWLQVKEGLTETPFRVKGWGKNRPRASNRTEEGRRRNRRVEVTIMTEP